MTQIKPHWIPRKINTSSIWNVKLVPALPMYTGHVTDISLSLHLTKQMTRQWTRPSRDIATVKYTLSGNWALWKDTKRKWTSCTDHRYRLMAKICMHNTLFPLTIITLTTTLDRSTTTDYRSKRQQVSVQNLGCHGTERRNKPSPCFTRFTPFCFNAPCQFTPLFNLHSFSV